MEQEAAWASRLPGSAPATKPWRNCENSINKARNPAVPGFRIQWRGAEDYELFSLIASLIASMTIFRFSAGIV